MFRATGLQLWETWTCSFEQTNYRMVLENLYAWEKIGSVGDLLPIYFFCIENIANKKLKLLFAFG